MRFNLYTGEDPTWVLIKKLAGDNSIRIFGLQIGRLFSGFLYETKKGGFIESDFIFDKNDKEILRKIIDAQLQNNTGIASTSELLRLKLKLDIAVDPPQTK